MKNVFYFIVVLLFVPGLSLADNYLMDDSKTPLTTFETKINEIAQSTTTSGQDLTSVAESTTSLRDDINAIAVSTGLIQNQVNEIAVSTGLLQGQIDGIVISTGNYLTKSSATATYANLNGATFTGDVTFDTITVLGTGYFYTIVTSTIVANVVHSTYGYVMGLYAQPPFTTIPIFNTIDMKGNNVINALNIQEDTTTLKDRIDGHDTRLDTVGVDTQTIRNDLNAVKVSTGLIQGQVNSIAISTGLIQNQVNEIAVSTGTLLTQSSATATYSQLNSTPTFYGVRSNGGYTCPDGTILTSTSGISDGLRYVVETDTGMRVSTNVYIQGNISIPNNAIFGINPVVAVHSTGTAHWDSNWKTLGIDLEDDSTLQVGQETMILCWNATGGTLTNGTVVYISSAVNGYPSISKADATDINKSFVLGVVTVTSMPDNSFGYVTIRGMVNDVDTSAWDIGTSLYLSGTVPGSLTSTPPTAGQYDVRVGRVMIKDGTTGRIYINIRPMMNLTDLGDVTIASAKTDEVLRYNGTEWVNGDLSQVSAGVGVEFYYDGTTVTVTGTDNSNKIETLSKSPWNNIERVESYTGAANTTISHDAYLYDTALNRTSLSAGTWAFPIYVGVSGTGGTTVMSCNLMIVSTFTCTITSTGTGTSRTIYVSGGTPFDNINATPVVDYASYLQLPSGLYQITASTSSTICTITVPTTYANVVSTSPVKVWRRWFQVATTDMNNTATAPLYLGLQLYDLKTVQASTPVATNDRIGVIRFSSATNSSINVFFAYGGSTRYSHLETPLSTLHGNLAGLQGGQGSVPTEEYYHLTSAELATVQSFNSATYLNTTGSTQTKTGGLNIGGNISATEYTNVSVTSTSMVATQVVTTDWISLIGSTITMTSLGGTDVTYLFEATVYCSTSMADTECRVLFDGTTGYVRAFTSVAQNAKGVIVLNYVPPDPISAGVHNLSVQCRANEGLSTISVGRIRYREIRR